MLRAACEAILPPSPPPLLPQGAGDVPLERFFDDLALRAPAEFRVGLRGCIWLLTFAPLFILGRPRLFLGLTATERGVLLQRLSENPIYLLRELPLLFKTVACLALCGTPEVQTHLNIAPRDSRAAAWLEQ